MNYLMLLPLGSLLSISAWANLKTAVDYERKVICHYLWEESVSTNRGYSVNSGHAALSCSKVKSISNGLEVIADTPIKVSIKNESGQVCYYLYERPFYNYMNAAHGGKAAISCVPL